MKKGIFISIEGGEGSGKTTQTEFIRRYLAGRGFDVLLTFEPGGTKVGKRIRRIILDPSSRGIDRICELFLYLADRAQHVRDVIEPALKKGQVVVSDRFTDATVAYQGFGRGISRQLIRILNTAAASGVKPDLTICLDLGPHEGLRRAKRKGIKDRIEDEGLSFHERVREGYLRSAGEEPSRIKIVKVVSPPSRVFGSIKKHIDSVIRRRS